MGAERQGIREATNALFDDYLIQIIEYSGGLIQIGKYFAVIGVAIKLVMQFKDPKTRAEPWGYFSWLVLAFFLLNYTAFIQGIFDVYAQIANALASSSIDWDTAFSQLDFAMMKTTDFSFFSKETFDSISSVGIQKSLYQAYKVKMLSHALVIIVLVVKVVSTVVFVFVKAYAVIYLMILIVFGPINIGLSFIPSLDGMWKGWLQKLLNVSLWIPMLYLIDAFMLGLIDTLFNSLLTQNIDLGKVWGASMLSAMAIFMYIKAPSLSNFVVQGSSVGKLTMGEKTKSAASKALSVGKKIGGVMSGNPAAAAS